MWRRQCSVRVAALLEQAEISHAPPPIIHPLSPTKRSYLPISISGITTTLASELETGVKTRRLESGSCLDLSSFNTCLTPANPFMSLQLSFFMSCLLMFYQDHNIGKQIMWSPIIGSTVTCLHLFFFLVLFSFNFTHFIILITLLSSVYLLTSFPNSYSFFFWLFSHQYSLLLRHNPMSFSLCKQKPSFFLVHLVSTISSTCLFHPPAKPTQVSHHSCRKSHTNSLCMKYFQIQSPRISKQAFGRQHLVHSEQYHFSDL